MFISLATLASFLKVLGAVVPRGARPGAPGARGAGNDGRGAGRAGGALRAARRAPVLPAALHPRSGGGERRRWRCRPRAELLGGPWGLTVGGGGVAIAIVGAARAGVRDGRARRSSPTACSAPVAPAPARSPVWTVRRGAHGGRRCATRRRASTCRSSTPSRGSTRTSAGACRRSRPALRRAFDVDALGLPAGRPAGRAVGGRGEPQPRRRAAGVPAVDRRRRDRRGGDRARTGAVRSGR